MTGVFTFRQIMKFLRYPAALTQAAKRRYLFAITVLAAGALSAQPCTPPVVSLGPDIEQCGGVYTLNAGNPGATYLWSDNSTAQTLTVNGTGTYSVEVSTGPGCSATASVNVTINPLPEPDLGPDVTTCGGQVTLDPEDGNVITIVDQSQGNTFSDIAGFYQNGAAQSFIPAMSAISGASVTLSGSLAGTGDITIALYTDLPNQGGILLASGTATGVTEGSMAIVSWPTITVSPGVVYYLVFTSSNPNLVIAGDLANPYPNGIVYANANFDPFPNQDYAFETYAGTAYYWSDGSNTRQVQVSTSGSYTVTVTNAYNCSASAQVDIYIKPVPVVNLGPDVTQCGGSVTIDAGNPGATYRWNDGSTQQFLTATTTDNYSVTVTDPNSSCTSSDVVTINIQQPPAVNLGPDVVSCNSSATLDAGNPGATYAWSTGETTQEITVTHNGFYIVTVSNPNTCSATASANVVLQPLPLLGEDKAGNICPFTTANLTTFYVTQGLTTTYNTPTPQAVEAGFYELIVSNQYGCTDTANITINYLPKPDFGPDVTAEICPFSTANLTSYINAPGVAINYGVADPTAVPAGIYTVMGTNSDGCADTLLITISYTPKPDLGADGVDSVCTGYTVDLTALYPNQGYASYVWNTGTPATAGPGSYTLIVANVQGCTDTANVVVSNRQQPVVTLNIDNDVCHNDTPFILTGGLPLGGVYRVNGTPLTQFNPVTMGIGTHVVVYEYTNASGCTDSATQLLMVHPQPFITTLLQPDLCTTSQAIDLDDYFSPTGGVYSGLGISQHYFYPVLTPSGRDTIVYVYVDEFGCSDTSVYPIRIHAPVKTILTSSPAEFSVCQGQSVTFTATGAELYEFFVNGVSQGAASGTNTFVTTTLNNLDQVTVVGSNICSSDTAGPILYDVHPLPVADAGPDTTIILGATVQLQGRAGGTGLLIYNWLPGTGLNVTNILNPIYSGTDTITFTLYVMDTYGCMDTDQVTINVMIPDEIVLPNVLTPDGDGKNDVWKIHPKIDLTGSELTIFDRWGQLVYETSNYANNWGGTYRATGTPVQDGTYYYVLKVPFQNNHIYRGAINILNGMAK